MNTMNVTQKFYVPVEFTEDLLINYDQKIFSPTQWNSIFIPSLPSAFVDEDILIYLIQEVFRLGSVKRVDIIKKENATNRLMAFVHFNHWFNCPSTHIFREKMEKDGLVDIFGYLDENRDRIGYNVLLDAKIKKDTFLRFMINKTPIKETELNIHQLADCLEKAEHKINDKESMIQQLQLELLESKLKMENVLTKNKLLENEIMQLKNDQFLKRVRMNYGYSDNLSEVDSDDVSEIGELDFNYKIEKPKLVRECYIDETLENASMINLLNPMDNRSEFYSQYSY